jgi:hypothetical protein
LLDSVFTAAKPAVLVCSNDTSPVGVLAVGAADRAGAESGDDDGRAGYSALLRPLLECRSQRSGARLVAWREGDEVGEHDASLAGLAGYEFLFELSATGDHRDGEPVADIGRLAHGLSGIINPRRRRAEDDADLVGAVAEHIVDLSGGQR